MLPRHSVPNTLPAMAKASANYMNSQLMKMEALVDGYAEAIALDASGFVSEGSGQNVFAVFKGELVTPPMSEGVLAGITRATLLALAQQAGIATREARLEPADIDDASEALLCNSLLAVRPLAQLGARYFGPGLVTAELARRYDLLTRS